MENIALEQTNPKQLRRVVRAQALHLQEQAARTENDFWNLAKSYDKLDALRERKERYWEKLSTENFIEWRVRASETVIPRPLDHEWWRSIMNGNFIDVIFDCPHELHELVTSPSVIEPLRSLDEARKEVLYYRLIRQWSPQRLAMVRGQTDRNIRKVYDTAIRQVRKRLYARLSPRYENDLPLTSEQREFCKNYKTALADGLDYDDICKKTLTIPEMADVDDDDIPEVNIENPNADNDNDSDDFNESAYLTAEPDEMYFDTFHFDDGKESDYETE